MAMTRANFSLNINRLIESFGEKTFSTFRVELIWNDVKDLSDLWMNRVTDGFLAENRFPPLPNEFHELMVIEKRSSHYEEKNPRGTCGACSDGLIYAMLRDNSHSSQYVFKCECSVGRTRAENFPKWIGDLRFQTV